MHTPHTFLSDHGTTHRSGSFKPYVYIISCLARSACCCCSYAYTSWIVQLGLRPPNTIPCPNLKANSRSPTSALRLLCNCHPQGFVRPESRVEVPGCQCHGQARLSFIRFVAPRVHPRCFCNFPSRVHGHGHMGLQSHSSSLSPPPRLGSHIVVQSHAHTHVHARCEVRYHPACLPQHSARSERRRYNAELFQTHPFFVNFHP